MTYEKPEVVPLGSAVDLIQHCEKGSGKVDSDPVGCGSNQKTIAAYGADE